MKNWVKISNLCIDASRLESMSRAIAAALEDCAGGGEIYCNAVYQLAILLESHKAALSALGQEMRKEEYKEETVA